MKSGLYTRTGDSGTTSLVGGERVKKNCVRIEAYGTIDELSSHLGIISSSPDCPKSVREEVSEIQNELFNIGSYLACETKEGEQPLCPPPSPEKLARLEENIDSLDEQTPKIKAFVLPGGTPLSAHTHVARTVCRRAERRILDLTEEAYVDPILIRYINRLSDYLFIAARYINFKLGVEDTVWRK